ncbi:hypothetical protein [Chryseobacterium terrae]|uniref:Uncharacterized protein n=1 Tax=Chryseobacterium terrae TaxID=3163299 RepID=A0ABW8Y767_9FLAO
MKPFQLFILLFILISCKKENIYYYSDNTPIKDSTVIRFVDEELEKLKINIDVKNLKIYTTLDSTSYKTNLDSIRNSIFEKALTYNFKSEDKKAFDQWFREKIIVVDNKSRKVISYYSSFSDKKHNRKDVSIGGLRKLIRIGNALYENPDLEIPENYLHSYGITSGKELEIHKEEAKFLSKFDINNLNTEDYFYNYISYLDAIALFTTYKDGLIKRPSVIEKVLNKEKTIYLKKDHSIKIFDTKSLQKIKNLLTYQKEHSFGAFKIQLENTENLFFFGTNADYNMIINDGTYTYLIYHFGVIFTDFEKKKTKQIPPIWMKKAGIRYYNAIRK